MIPKYADTYQGFDYAAIDSLLTEEQKNARMEARSWVNEALLPIVDDCAQKEHFPLELVQKMGTAGLLGPQIPTQYGGRAVDYITYGLIMQEIERGDSGIRSCCSVQSSLVIYPIYLYGSEEQKDKYLPALTSGKMLGCFALTEPNHGSNPAGMETRLIRQGDHYLLQGEKRWATNGPFSDIGIVWAKDEEGEVRGVIVEKEMKGFERITLSDRWSLRASASGALKFTDVVIREEQILPKAKGLKAPLTCLSSARYGIAWGAIGAAMDCLHTALCYAKERQQFDKPLAAFQLTQKKLAECLTQITNAQLLAFRVGQLLNEGKATPQQISMAKRNNVEMALHIARETRQILGANGILGEYSIMRHMMNLESVITYEGTHDVHLLITGMDLTGINAFG